MQNSGLTLAIEAAGSINKLADGLGITPEAIYQWDRIPVGRVIQIETKFGVPRESLRPDIYPARAESGNGSKGEGQARIRTEAVEA